MTAAARRGGRRPARRARRARPARAAGLVLLALGLGGCLTPPAIMPGGQRTLALEPERFPADAELVELPVGDAAADGVVLRGVFVPSDPGAPVVLHLLESSASITSDSTVLRSGLLTLGFHPGRRLVIDHLADRGYASLVVDYSGVGASGGTRSPEHLARDAAAMWAEAVARAGGDPSRVVLRGISIGTLAAAALLADGARPGAVALLLPVQHDTVGEHFAAASYGGLLATLLAPFFDDVGAADLDQQLAACESPLLVAVVESDELLPPEEQAALRAVVEERDGAWVVLPEGDGAQLSGMVLRHHFLGTSEARALLPEEDALLRDVFGDPAARDDRFAAAWDALTPHEKRFVPPGGLEHVRFEALARGRLHDDPRDLAALACTPSDLEQAGRALDLLRGPLRGWIGDRDLDGRLRLLDTGDPDGVLPLDTILALALQDRSLPQEPWSPPRTPPGLDEIAALAARLAADGSGYPGWNDEVLAAIRGPEPDHVDAADLRRRVTRVLLKVHGYEDRVVPATRGPIRVQVHRGHGAWEDVDLGAAGVR